MLCIAGWVRPSKALALLIGYLMKIVGGRVVVKLISSLFARLHRHFHGLHERVVVLVRHSWLLGSRSVTEGVYGRTVVTVGGIIQC